MTSTRVSTAATTASTRALVGQEMASRMGERGYHAWRGGLLVEWPPRVIQVQTPAKAGDQPTAPRPCGRVAPPGDRQQRAARQEGRPAWTPPLRGAHRGVDGLPGHGGGRPGDNRLLTRPASANGKEPLIRLHTTHPRALAGLAIVLAAWALGSAGAAALASPSAHRGGSVHVSGVFGRRYCELLLVHPGRHGLIADVYNTYGLNNCPPARWRAIDLSTVAKANHAVLVVRNGPRYWLMNQIVKVFGKARVVRDLGGVRMTLAATLPVNPASTAPYTIHSVDRRSQFEFNAGSTVYELHGPGHSTWVMQSYSRQIDPTFRLSALAKLGARLKLPAGWTFQVRRLRRSLTITTVRRSARVTQDNLDNTYSEL